MRISELARRAGVKATAIRYYEELGVLDRARRTSSGYRDYDERALARLTFILRAKEVGFTLPEITRLLASEHDRRTRGVEGLVAKKLRDIAAQRRALQVVETRLRKLRRHLHDGTGEQPELARWLLLTEEVTMSEPTRSALDDEARAVLNAAADEALDLQHDWVGAEHLLLALLKEERGSAARVLRASGVTAARTRAAVLAVTGRGAAASTQATFTPRLQQVIGMARGLALGDERLADANDLFVALLECGETIASAVLVQQGTDLARLRTLIRPRRDT